MPANPLDVPDPSWSTKDPCSGQVHARGVPPTRPAAGTRRARAPLAPAVPPRTAPSNLETHVAAAARAASTTLESSHPKPTLCPPAPLRLRPPLPLLPQILAAAAAAYGDTCPVLFRTRNRGKDGQEARKLGEQLAAAAEMIAKAEDGVRLTAAQKATAATGKVLCTSWLHMPIELHMPID